MNALNVYWDTELVGRLAKVGAQDMSFQYSDGYLASKHPQPISLSLPFQSEAFAEPVSKSCCAEWALTRGDDSVLDG